MLQHIATYIPEDRLFSLATKKAISSPSFGSVLIADISGFSELTEKLRMALGARRGAEGLTQYLNSVYSSLITEVEKFSGSVIDFAGDAIICWFSQNEENTISAAQNAVTCALAQQKAMSAHAQKDYFSHHELNLALKISIATGFVHRLVVGDPEIRLMDQLAGNPVTRMSLGKNLAHRGEILVDAATADILGKYLILQRKVAQNW